MGAFIEECYRKGFGGEADDADPRVPKPRPNARSASQKEAVAPRSLGTAESQLSNLVCYLVNLADDLEKWLVHDTVDREIIAQISGELREIAQALDIGAPISPLPAIPLPPRPGPRVHSRHHRVQPHLDDEIPF